MGKKNTDTTDTAALKAQLTELLDAGLTFGDVVSVVSERDRAENPDYETYRRKAFDQYHSDGEIEIDSDVVLSPGEDDGLYVSAWVWVDN